MKPLLINIDSNTKMFEVRHPVVLLQRVLTEHYSTVIKLFISIRTEVRRAKWKSTALSSITFHKTLYSYNVDTDSMSHTIQKLFFTADLDPLPPMGGK